MRALLTPQTLFLSVCAVVYLAALAALVAARPDVGMVLTAVAMALTLNLRYSKSGTVRSIAVDVGSVSVGLPDVLAVLMLGVAMFCCVRRRSVGAWELPLWSILALVGLNAVRGAGEFPLQQVLNETRPWLSLWSAVLFGATMPLPRRSRLLVGGLVAYTAWLLGVATVGFLTTGVHTVTEAIYVNDELVDPRPIAASGALVLAEVLILLVAAHARLGRVVVLLVGSAIAAVVVLLQHRTIWVATALAFGYVAVRAIVSGGRGRSIAVPALAVAGLVTFVTTATGVLRQTALAASASNALGHDNTLSWRVLGWRQLLGSDRGVEDVAVGEPFGRGFLRVVNDVTLTVSAHSQYVSTILRLGLIGLAGVVWLLVVAWWNAPAAADRLGVPPAFLRGILILIVLYGAAYSWDPVQGLALGLLIGFTRRRPAPASSGEAARAPTRRSRPEPTFVPSTAPR